ncbi:DUF2306 domain-containing protein [Paraburkholderia sediminicola]|uniref:DUF2306 domain-containing protein n=1 Tax=Paraburkholderia rhynchosiae TaxID=487049 RepID=A0ACC7N8V3_9BURK
MESPIPLADYTKRALYAVTWISMTCFALYIAIFYGGAIPAHALEDWNLLLPDVYVKGALVQTAAIAAHFIAGAVLLAIGPAQIITGHHGITPKLHRVTGRIYAAAAAFAGFGGLTYIALQGTVGGTVMDIGFSLYGLSVIVAALETYRNARMKRFDRHRAWAIRLVALAVGSWLFRLDYGLWLKATHGLGHSQSYRGPFDQIMAFFFYVPNLLIAELIIRRPEQSTWSRAALGVVTGTATVLVATSTYLFGASSWWPHIAARLGIG